MSWASIGGNEVITIKNWQRSMMGMTLVDITRLGINGVAFIRIGNRSRPTPLLTIVDLANAAAVETTLAAYLALKGTLTTIVDDLQISVANVAILEMMPMRQQAVACPSGGVNGGSYLFGCQWIVQETQ